MVSDDEREEEADQPALQTTSPTTQPPWETDGKPRNFDLNGPTTQQERDSSPVVVIDEEDRQEHTDTSELLKMH